MGTLIKGINDASDTFTKLERAVNDLRWKGKFLNDSQKLQVVRIINETGCDAEEAMAELIDGGWHATQDAIGRIKFKRSTRISQCDDWLKKYQ